MYWIATFVISWIIFWAIVDLRHIKYTVWGGVIAVIFQLTVDEIATSLNLYSFSDPVVTILKSSFFFTFGAPFCIGVLYAQTYPKRKILQLVNLFMLTFMFFIMEYSLHRVGALKYTNWNYIYSLVVDLGALLAIGQLINLLQLSPWMRRKENER
ncbi:MAG: CBO0543 family protein [Caldanaerobacter sp.]|uniref:CBO0543 family protein n=1 Tax=Caldanaerobacter sp. TaxID=2930036 RepID=UPI003C7352C8